VSALHTGHGGQIEFVAQSAKTAGDVEVLEDLVVVHVRDCAVGDLCAPTFSGNFEFATALAPALGDTVYWESNAVALLGSQKLGYVVATSATHVTVALAGGVAAQSAFIPVGGKFGGGLK